MDGFSTFALTIFVLAVVLVFLGVKSVPQGYIWTVERFGKFTKELRPGLNFIVPVVDKIGRKINVMEQVLDIPSQDVITRDNAQVQVDGVVYVVVADAPKAAYEVLNLDRAITNLSMTSIRSVLGEMDLDQALSNRDEINNKLLKIIDEAARPWGTLIKRVEIKDISPPDDLVQSMARQMKAEREKRANILEAEGRLEAAQRDAEARERLAEAEARATYAVSKAIAEGDINAINYFVATKYTDALQAIASSENSKLVMMPLEAGNLIGAVGGISELLSKTGVANKAVS